MNFKLEILDNESVLLHGSLGITEDRMKELKKIVHHAFVEENSILDQFNIYAKECKHFNEVYYCIFYQAELDCKDNIYNNLYRRD